MRFTLSLILVFCFFQACTNESAPEVKSPTPSAAATAETPQAPPFLIEKDTEDGIYLVTVPDVDQSALKDILAAADLQDGQVDQVVHRCVGCKMNMDGSEAYGVHVLGYTTHHCSAQCRDHFMEQPRENFFAIKGDLAPEL